MIIEALNVQIKQFLADKNGWSSSFGIEIGTSNTP
jgi:hypothetical protein